MISNYNNQSDIATLLYQQVITVEITINVWFKLDVVQEQKHFKHWNRYVLNEQCYF